MKQEIIDFAREKFVEAPGEEVLGDEIRKYQQIHLAVAFMGEDYREKARIKIAKQAIANGCEWAVDGDYCQDHYMSKSVILAATGLRKTPKKRIIKPIFPKKIISHISDEEFLSRMGENPEDYDSINLAAEYLGSKYVEMAEIRLARIALRAKCKWVTQMDYVFHNPKKNYVRIKAKGLIKKF